MSLDRLRDQSDHSALAKLGEDTHTQYFNQARGDARYRQIGQTTIRIPHTWHFPGEVKVASGDTDYILPMITAVPAGATAVIRHARFLITSGTSVTFSMNYDGSNLAGLTGLVASQSLNGSGVVSLGMDDSKLLRPVVSAVSGTPKNLTITLAVDYTV